MPPAAGVPAAQASDAARSPAFLAQCHTFPLRLRYPQPAFSNSMTLRCQPKKRAVFSRWEKIPSHETRASPPGQSESAQARFRPPRARLRRLHPEILRKREDRSEEHTSELQSPCNLVCRLLLEKKKKKNKI